ncbi:MAG: hypothetical protein AAF750_07765 [Planctomycetota bacterium]
MLKFFRKYNKLILVVGASLLMVAFLIQPVLSIFLPDPRKQPIAEAHGDTLTVADLRSASLELDLLRDLGVRSPFFADADQNLLEQGVRLPLPSDEEDWLLLLKNAEELGIVAGPTQVSAFYQMQGVSADTLAQLATSRRVTRGFIDQAVGHYIVSQQYLDLASGVLYRNDPGLPAAPALRYLTELARAGNAINLLRQVARGPRSFQQIQNINFLQGEAVTAMREASGQQRLSEPLIAYRTQQALATLDAQMLLIPSSPRVDPDLQPDAARLAELYETHKDQPPGSSEPFGLGYQLPAQVRFEVLTIRLEDVVKAVRQTITQDDIQQAYAESPQKYDRFRLDDALSADAAATQPGAAAGPRPVLSRNTRNRIADQLAKDRANARLLDILAAVQSRLARDVRQAPINLSGVRDTSNLTPTPFQEVADAIAGNPDLGVELLVQDHTDRWTAIADLEGIVPIGEAFVTDTGQSFTDYLAATHELQPTPEGDPADAPPLPSNTLQVKLPSLPLATQDGSLHIVRVTAAQPARAPESLDAVREQVLADARLLDAYDKLLADRESLVNQIAETNLTAVSEGLTDAAITTLLDITPTDPQPGELGPPDLQNLGRHAPSVDALFDKAQALGTNAASNGLTADRLVAVPVDEKQALAIFLIESFSPLTRSAFNQSIGDPLNLLNTHLTVKADAPTTDPMAGLRERVGYVER